MMRSLCCSILRPAPRRHSHVQVFARQSKLNRGRHRFHRRDETAHRGNLAVYPGREALYKIAHRMGIDADRHDDFDAAAHVHARREPPRTRADADRKRVAGAARLEQRIAACLVASSLRMIPG